MVWVGCALGISMEYLGFPIRMDFIDRLPLPSSTLTRSGEPGT